MQKLMVTKTFLLCIISNSSAFKLEINLVSIKKRETQPKNNFKKESIISIMVYKKRYIILYKAYVSTKSQCLNVHMFNTFMMLRRKASSLDAGVNLRSSDRLVTQDSPIFWSREPLFFNKVKLWEDINIKKR